jgi:hypothetical protein
VHLRLDGVQCFECRAHDVLRTIVASRGQMPDNLVGSRRA